MEVSNKVLTKSKFPLFNILGLISRWLYTSPNNLIYFSFVMWLIKIGAKNILAASNFRVDVLRNIGSTGNKNVMKNLIFH